MLKSTVIAGSQQGPASAPHSPSPASDKTCGSGSESVVDVAGWLFTTGPREVIHTAPHDELGTVYRHVANLGSSGGPASITGQDSAGVRPRYGCAKRKGFFSIGRSRVGVSWSATTA